MITKLKDCGIRSGASLPDVKRLERHVEKAPKRFATFLLWAFLTADEPDVEDPECIAKDDALRLIHNLVMETISLDRSKRTI